MTGWIHRVGDRVIPEVLTHNEGCGGNISDRPDWMECRCGKIWSDADLAIAIRNGTVHSTVAEAMKSLEAPPSSGE